MQTRIRPPPGADRKVAVVSPASSWKTICARGARLVTVAGRLSSPLGVTTRVASRPTDDSVTPLHHVLDPLNEPQRADERKRTDVRLRQFALQARGRRQQRPALGDHVIDQYDSV